MSEPSESKPKNYRNPPPEHRFRKGVSGNPKGRPRRNPALVSTKVDGKPGIGSEDPVKSLAIKEAYRVITVREGDRVERIPVIQAILRKVAIAAANGNTRAQQNFLTLVSGAESDRRVAAAEMLAVSVEYKEHWHRILAERARNGTAGPEPVPHPDDVIINHETGEVTIDGPILEGQKEALDKLLVMWPKLERDLLEVNKMLEADPTNQNLLAAKNRLTGPVHYARAQNLKRSIRDKIRAAPTKQ